MNQLNSNSKFKQKLLKYLLTLLIILTAVQFTQPITAYADSSNVTKLNGGAEHGYGSQVGKMHWAGSTTRTGFLFYFIDNNGKIITTDELGLSNRVDAPIVIKVFNDEYRKEIEMWNTDVSLLKYYYYDEFNRMNNRVIEAEEIWHPNAPYAVKWDDNTGRWSGNGQAVADWLFSEDGTSYQMWEYILRVGLKAYTNSGTEINDVINQLKRYETINIVIEPIAVNAVYGTETWGDSVNTIILDKDKDKDFGAYIHPSNYKPALKEYNDGTSEIIRVESTATYMSKYVYEKTGCATGGANWKWTNEALPFCMTLQESDLGKEAIPQGTKPRRIDYVTINSKEMSYGMGALNKTIRIDFIDTYNGTSDKPAPTEKTVKTDDKDTTGNNSITKIYFDIEVDALSGITTYKFIDAFTTKNTTGNIQMINETTKTGYTILKWGIAEDGEDYSRYYRDSGYNSIVRSLSSLGKNGGKTYVTKQFFLDEKDKAEVGKPKHLYILYTNTITIPAPEVEDYDFEIPESYITKQVYFSLGSNTSNTNPTAQKLINQQFEWISEAHSNCPGHKVIGCGTAEHTHKPWMNSYNPGCYEEIDVTVYECNNDKESKCGKEHIHSDENCKELTGYKCIKCGATGNTQNKVKNSALHRNCKGAINPVYSNFKVSAFKCVQCSKVYSTRPNSCSICHSGTFIDACGTEYHKCSDHSKTVSKITEYTVCGLDEHVHKLECFSKTVYCSPTWEDNSLSLGIKNTKQSDFPNILATNANWSTTVKADQALTIALQGSKLDVAGLYKWVSSVRNTTDADTQKESFDYSTILLRGADEITLPEWLKDYVLIENGIKIIDQPTVMQNLVGTNSISSTKFKVGNTPQGNRKYDTYQEVFSAAFKDNAEDKETVLGFNYPSGVSSSTLEWVSNIIPIRAFDKCDANSKVYTLQTPYEIPTIKVKVNVLPTTETQSTNSQTQINGNTTISFYPYVRMYYDTPSLKNKPALVLGETQRHFKAHDGADIKFTQGTGLLDITTAQWSTHKGAETALKQQAPSANPDRILKHHHL